jgi:alkyl hydroperoxide reductase subunit AhpF
MGLLGDEDLAFLKDNFKQLAHDVQLTVVVREPSRLVVPGREEPAEDASAELKQLCGELAGTSERIRLEVVDAAQDPERGRALTGDRYPALVMSSATARGRLRYFGLPAGYELSTVVANVLDLGTAAEPLPDEVAARLAALPGDVRVQVFVTPT